MPTTLIHTYISSLLYAIFIYKGMNVCVCVCGAGCVSGMKNIHRCVAEQMIKRWMCRPFRYYSAMLLVCWLSSIRVFCYAAHAFRMYWAAAHTPRQHKRHGYNVYIIHQNGWEDVIFFYFCCCCYYYFYWCVCGSNKIARRWWKTVAA